MLPFGIGIPEVLMILVVVLLVVGPSKLPELARTLAKGIRAARRAGEEIRNAIDIDDLDEPPRRAWEASQRVEEAEPFHADDMDCEHEDDHDPGPSPMARQSATSSPAFFGSTENAPSDVEPAEVPQDAATDSAHESSSAQSQTAPDEVT